MNPPMLHHVVEPGLDFALIGLWVIWYPKASLEDERRILGFYWQYMVEVIISTFAVGLGDDFGV